MKNNKYVRIYKRFNSIRIFLVLGSIVNLFVGVSRVEFDNLPIKSLRSPMIVFIIIGLITFLADKVLFKLTSIPESNKGITIIKESESFLKNSGYFDSIDVGHIKGLWRGYSFEYRNDRKISYTKTKLFNQRIENTGYKEFLDDLYKTYGYVPTGRVVFRGYWVKKNGKFYKVEYGKDFQVDLNRKPVFKNSKIRVQSSNGICLGEGVVTGIRNDFVIYSSDYKSRDRRTSYNADIVVV